MPLLVFFQGLGVGCSDNYIHSQKTTCPKYRLLVKAILHACARNSRVSKGISAKASHRTVREPLNSYGSCYPSCFYSQSPMIEQVRVSGLYCPIFIIQPCFSSYLVSVLYPLTDKFIQIVKHIKPYHPIEPGIIIIIQPLIFGFNRSANFSNFT
jgi:hypothetical protein